MIKTVSLPKLCLEPLTENLEDKRIIFFLSEINFSMRNFLKDKKKHNHSKVAFRLIVPYNNEGF
jgi:hypothetical protein